MTDEISEAIREAQIRDVFFMMQPYERAVIRAFLEQEKRKAFEGGFKWGIRWSGESYDEMFAEYQAQTKEGE